MAVLATYREDYCLAVYYYCRSILTLQPFTGGYENLAVIFCKNTTKFQILNEKSNSNSYNNHRDRKSFMKLNNFMTLFIRLHGLLFWWNTLIQSETEESELSQNSQGEYFNLLTKKSGENGILSAEKMGLSKVNERINPDYYQDILRRTMKEYDELLQLPTLTDTILIKLLVICIFSIHHSIATMEGTLIANAVKSTNSSQLTENDTDNNSSASQLLLSIRASTASLARTTLYNMITK